MDPVTVGIASELVGRGIKGVSTYAKQKGVFDEDAAKRLKELERMEAINMLGGDIQTYQSQQMTPVQGAMREARERMAQDISSQDLSGGAYFRGQQAMTEAAGQERAAAEARAQEQFRREEDAKRAEMESLKQRKQVSDNAARDAFLASIEGVDKSAQSFAMMRVEQDKIQALRDLAGKGLTSDETKIAETAFKSWHDDTSTPTPGFEAMAELYKSVQEGYPENLDEQFGEGGPDPETSERPIWGEGVKAAIDETARRKKRAAERRAIVKKLMEEE